jgi:hypothetical protein
MTGIDQISLTQIFTYHVMQQKPHGPICFHRQTVIIYSRVSFHFYDTCRVGPSIPDLSCITVATQASSLYLLAYLLHGAESFLRS